MNLEVVKIEELKPLEKNVRKHNEKQVDELVRSLNQFGQTRAIVIDEENNILIGNGLYFAMKKRGDTECECFRKTGLSEKDKKKLILTDNKVFSLGMDEYEVINDFIHDIAGEGDFEIAGFDEEVIRQMTRDLEEINSDIMNQGMIEPEVIKTVSAAPTVQPKIETASAPAAPAESDIEPEIEVSSHEEVKEVHHAEEKSVKTIVCPCCGEVIYLD